MDILNLVLAGLGGAAIGEEARKKIRKTLEKSAIKAFCAPPIKTEKEEIIKKFDEEIKTLATTNKTAMTTLSYQMDTAISGLGQKAINSAVEKHITDFDKF